MVTRRLHPRAALRLAAALGIFALLPALARAEPPASLLIWPVNPVIEADRQAAALWLENPGSTPVTLQVRIFAWAQQDSQNVYAAQDKVLPSPPLVTIAPGARQLVRLTRTAPPPSVGENAYRVIVDEIPTRSPAEASSAAAVSFRMRYSLPLFVPAPYAAPSRNGARKDPADAPAPSLSWRIGEDASGAFVEIVNSGNLHARLVEARLEEGARSVPLAPGLLGYVLAGSRARWPLPEGAPRAQLSAGVNGGERQMLAPADE